jgi:hypothetical protein
VEVLLDIHFKHVIFELQQYEQQILQQHMEMYINGEEIKHFLERVYLEYYHNKQQL